jgi:RNA polymerase sigma-70 factor (ECF subfamily)
MLGPTGATTPPDDPKRWPVVDIEQLFRAHEREVYVYFLRTLGDHHVAEDLAQETFARAYRSALFFRGESSLRTWLFGIARNVLLRHLRRKGRPAPDTDRAPSSGPDPVVRLGVEEALFALPVADREVLVRCDLLGHTPSEAAEAMGVTANALRVRLHRARRRFREAYGDAG